MPSSKNSVFVIVMVVVLLGVVPALAERGDDADRVSKNGKTEGSIGEVSITLEYGRPNVKGRTIWGGLVPYGEVWRTGANEATTISINQDVMVERTSRDPMTESIENESVRRFLGAQNGGGQVPPTRSSTCPC